MAKQGKSFPQARIGFKTRLAATGAPGRVPAPNTPGKPAPPKAKKGK